MSNHDDGSSMSTCAIIPRANARPDDILNNELGNLANIIRSVHLETTFLQCRSYYSSHLSGKEILLNGLDSSYFSLSICFNKLKIAKGLLGISIKNDYKCFLTLKEILQDTKECVEFNEYLATNNQAKTKMGQIKQNHNDLQLLIISRGNQKISHYTKCTLGAFHVCHVKMQRENLQTVTATISTMVHDTYSVWQNFFQQWRELNVLFRNENPSINFFRNNEDIKTKESKLDERTWLMYGVNIRSMNGYMYAKAAPGQFWSRRKSTEKWERMPNKLKLYENLDICIVATIP